MTERNGSSPLVVALANAGPADLHAIRARQAELRAELESLEAVEAILVRRLAKQGDDDERIDVQAEKPKRDVVKSSSSLTQTQRDIMDCIRQHGPATPAQMAPRLERSEHSIRVSVGQARTTFLTLRDGRIVIRGEYEDPDDD